MTKPLFAENGDELTPDEARAIQALERLSKRWPRSLTLISMGGGLCVKHTGDPRFDEAFGVDRAGCILYSFVGIPNDGGDW